MTYYRPQGPQAFTPVVRNLMIINVAIFAIAYLFKSQLGVAIYHYGVLWFPGTENFIFTQFFTSMFLHDPSGIGHLFFNMFALYMFGTGVERVWGWKRFLNYYLACGLGAAIVHIIVTYAIVGPNVDLSGSRMLGASGAIYGILAAFGYLYPNNKVYIYFLIPIKAKYFVALLILLDLFLGLSGTRDGVAHFAHLGGAITGLAYLFGSRFFRSRS